MKKIVKTVDLKPCPFCNGAAEIIDTHVYLDAAIRIGCGKCGVITPAVLIDHPAYRGGDLDESTRYTAEQAVAKAAAIWNKRTDIGTKGNQTMQKKSEIMNAVVLNGKVTELTEEQVKSIVDGLAAPAKTAGKKPLSEVKVGDTFNIGDHEFIVLEQSGDTTAVLSKVLIEDEIKFGDTPDFEKSNVKKILDKFAKEITQEIGDGALVTHTVDQTTLDGMSHYGISKAQMSLMTIDHVRKYAEVLDKHKSDKWYWLVTPWSTPDRGWETSMCCVAPSGDVNCNFSNCIGNGVRPFCILKSDIFVS